MCDKHFEGINPDMKTKQTTTSDKASAVTSDDGVRPPCCYNCKQLSYVGKIWCKEGVWDGLGSTDELLVETDCRLHETAQGEN